MIAQDQARKINPQLSGLDVPPPGLTNFDLHQQAKPITPGARAEYNALQIAKTQALPMELRNATAPGAFNGNIFGMKPRADGGKAVRKALMVAKDDAGKTMPESARVLHLQRQALLAGKRKAMLFPKGGGKESVVPPGMERMDTPDGVIHYNPAMVSEREIAQAVKNKRLNEVLGLGPYSKGDVVKRVAKGEKPVAVVARDPHGVEAAAALGTAGTAPEQLPHIAAQMPAAGSVGLENPAETVLRRADGGEVEDDFQIKKDNPGGDWLRYQREAAEESTRRVTGPVTAYLNKYIHLDPKKVSRIPGSLKENPVWGSPKYDALHESMSERGFDPEESGPILIGVNHRAEPYILEGNNRAAVARDLGIESIPAEIRWYAGGEREHDPHAFVRSLLPEHKADGGSVDDYNTMLGNPNTDGFIAKAGGGEVDPEQNVSPRAYFEVAPGKTWDADQQQSWEELHPQAKSAISNKMIGEFLSRWQRQTGIQGEVKAGLGGFDGYTNPNYTFHPYDPQQITAAVHGLGELFRQDAMMGAHAHPFPGSEPAGVVRVNLPKNMSPDDVHAIYKTLHERGLAEGHSTDIASGTMDIFHEDFKKAMQAGKEIDKTLNGKYVVKSFPTNISFPKHGAQYGLLSGISGRPGSSAPHADDSLQAEASSRLKELLEEAHRQGGGHQAPVDFGDTLSPGQPHPDTLSAVMPTTVSAYKGPPGAGQARTDISPSLHSPENLENISTRMWQQHPASGGETLPGNEAREKMVNLSVKNLLALYDRTPMGDRKTSRFWYRAAHALGNAYAEKHEIAPRVAHAIMAVLSPQTPWDKNVTLAERVMDALKNRQDTPWTAGMSDVVRNGGASGKGLPFDKGTKETGPHTWNDIEGKTLREVLAGPHGQQRAAMWIRAFDEAHNPSEYQSVSPTGEFMGTMMNKTGTAPDTSSWNSYMPIQKAISIWHDPSLENINNQIGNNHKVREFYNVITNPHDPNGVVIDTHAVAAGALLPHGSSAKEVHQNFGTTPDAKQKEQLAAKGFDWIEGIDPSKKTGSTGAVGDYPVHAEAVRRAAWARGIHPSEMQSVTWETVRRLFDNKSLPIQRKARAIWSRYASGELSHDQVVDEMFKMAGGLKKPVWSSQSGSGLGQARTGSYERPGDITAEMGALERKRAPSGGEDFSIGGLVDHALKITAKARKKAGPSFT